MRLRLTAYALLQLEVCEPTANLLQQDRRIKQAKREMVEGEDPP